MLKNGDFIRAAPCRIFPKTLRTPFFGGAKRIFYLRLKLQKVLDQVLSKRHLTCGKSL